MNYYERHIGDYLKDTSHLSLLEHGIYTRLMDVYYTREGAIHQDEAARLVGARSKDEKEALQVVLTEFFTFDDGMYIQDRCEREIERYQKKAAHNREVGKLGGRPPKLSVIQKPTGLFLGSENVTQIEPKPNPPSNQYPVTSNQEEKEQPSVACTRQVDCPHAEVLALWAETLPALPQHLPSQWRGKRADHLRARWRETAASEGWADQAQGLEFFRKLFAFVGRSRFLTGKVPPRANSTQFVVELEWLVSPNNWAKVIEGKYHQETA